MITARVKRSKVLGINLIGLIISSALGTFIVASIIKIIITANNNLLIIDGIAQLEQSSTRLDKLFKQFFAANGFGVNNFTNSINTFYISSDNNTLNFSMWYAGSNNSVNPTLGSFIDTVSCSGRKLSSTTVVQEIQINIQNPTNPSGSVIPGSLTCTLIPIGTTPRSTPMPLVAPQQLASFYVAAIVKFVDGGIEKFKVIPISRANADPTLVGGRRFDSYGIKLALVLRSINPVFNYNKTTNFSNILNVSGFNFTKNDKFLYKLITIEEPFLNVKNHENNTFMQTAIVFR